MRFFVHEVENPDDSDPSGKIFSSMWVNIENPRLADERAKAFIAEQGLVIIEEVESYTISQENYKDDPTGLEYFEQAKKDGEVMVLFKSQENRGEG